VALSTADELCPGDCFRTPVLDYFTKRARCYGYGVWSFVEQLVDAVINLDSGDDWLDVLGAAGDLVGELGASYAEYRFCYNSLLTTLNSTIQQNCRLYNWGYMSGAAEKTRDHGICNCSDPYFNTIGKSLVIQDDADGTAHLNRKAHEIVNKTIVENTLANYLTDTLNRMETQTISPGSNSNIFKVQGSADFTQKLEKNRSFDDSLTAKIKTIRKESKKMISAKIKTFKPQLIKLKNYFHQKALAEKANK